MGRAKLFVGTGTEVVIQAMIPACKEVLARSRGRWPEDLFVLMADSDRRAQNRVREARLPADQAMYIHLSLEQVKEALARHREEFKDAWRSEWMPMVRTAPDNGACMVPSLGRLMIKAARPAIAQVLEAVERKLAGRDQGAPDIFMVMNPLSGTSRGSIYDLPRYLRYMWPDAKVHALLVYPVDLETMDARAARIYQTNFIEALRILDHFCVSRSFEVFMDPRTGWEKREGELVNNIFAFDSRYGNQRFSQLDRSTYRLDGGLTELFANVAGFMAGVALNDRLTDWLLGRLADVSMHQSGYQIAGHRTHCHALHETKLAVDFDAMRRALVERAVQRVLGPFVSGDGTRPEVEPTGLDFL